jgi:acyl-CoA thioesterase-1
MTPMSFRAAVAAALLAIAAAARAAPVAVPPACATSDEFVTPDEPLNHLGTALTAAGPIEVLAVGSATMVGESSSSSQAGAPGTSFPYRMADALRTALPDMQIRLTVRGGRGLTADAMLPMLLQALKGQKYQLVLWQTGTVEAVRGLRPDNMQTALQEGADAVQEAGADLVLIDSQFSRFLRANADLDPYQTVLQQIATMPGVVLFHRFDIMRDWMHEGRIDLEKTPRAEREKAISLLNTCLGVTLARFVLNGATEK